MKPALILYIFLSVFCFAESFDDRIESFAKYEKIKGINSISPDGSKICFVSQLNDYDLRIYFKQDNGELIKIASSYRLVASPTWSPDSRFLAFHVQDRNKKSYPILYDTEEKLLSEFRNINLGHASVLWISPCWSSDSKNFFTLQITDDSQIPKAPASMNGDIDWPIDSVVQPYTSSSEKKFFEDAVEIGLSRRSDFLTRHMALVKSHISFPPAKICSINIDNKQISNVVLNITAAPRQFLTASHNPGKIFFFENKNNLSGKANCRLLEFDSSATNLSSQQLKTVVKNKDISLTSFLKTDDTSYFMEVNKDQGKAIWKITASNAESIVSIPKSKKAVMPRTYGTKRTDFSGPNGSIWTYSKAPLTIKENSLFFIENGRLFSFDKKSKKLKKHGSKNHYYTHHSGTHTNGILVDFFDKKGEQSGIALVNNKDLQILYSANNFLSIIQSNKSSARTYFIEESLSKPPSINIIDPITKKIEKGIDELNKDLTQLGLFKIEFLKWTVHNKTANGHLYIPDNKELMADNKFPMIIYPYPKTAPNKNNMNFFADLDILMRIALSKGYAVLIPGMPIQAPNVEGSHFMKDLNTAVNAACDAAIATGKVDPERLGITGHSWGGYTVFAVAVQNERFKAAISGAGYGDPAVNYLYPNEQGMLLGDRDWKTQPWKKPELYQKNSVLFHLDKVTTPLLIYHGLADYRVRPEESLIVFRGLSLLGKNTELLHYPDCGHSYTRWPYKSRKDFYSRFFKWMNNYLKQK